MRVTLPPQSRVVKKVLPRSLLGRSLLIMLVPLVIVLAVALQIFYGNHLNIVSRRLSAAVAAEIGMTIDIMAHLPDSDGRAWALQEAREHFDTAMTYQDGSVSEIKNFKR